MNNLNKRKILVIGADGGTFRLIDPLVRDGRLPNIEKLMQSGVRGDLRSTIPCVSPAAWTSFMTGTSPGKHRIYDFSGRVPGTYQFNINTTNSRAAKPFWSYLSEQGKRVLVEGVTQTYPPDPVNGYMISGLGIPPGAQPRDYIFPPDAAEELLSRVGPYSPVPEGDCRKLSDSDSEKKKFVESILVQIDYRVALFRYLWQKEHFDFSMVFFLDTDAISHYFWKYMDTAHRNYRSNEYGNAIQRVYEKVDAAVGELLSIVGSETDVIMVSDHGFGPLNRVVFLNNWLAANGYLRFKRRGPFTRLASSVMRRVPFLRGRGMKSGKQIDWDNTRAFFSGTVGNIYINMRGREPQGIVAPSDYEGLCAEISERLRNIADPENGERFVEQVYRKADIFSADSSGRAPDLHATFKSGYGVVGEEIALHRIRDTGKIIDDSFNWSGTHEPEGIFIARGKNFRPGCRIEGANLIDIAPTLLYAFGLPVPENMDGKPLLDMFAEDYRKANPVRTVLAEGAVREEAGPAAGTDDAAIQAQLRNLGYIE
jgi:predicted AlkP superfamily phosphohydrolase/phosphomutase